MPCRRRRRAWRCSLPISGQHRPLRSAVAGGAGGGREAVRDGSSRILLIGKAPVRKGEADLRPVLLAPTSRGGWTIGTWNGSAWFDLRSGRVLDPRIYVPLPRLRTGSS